MFIIGCYDSIMDLIIIFLTLVMFRPVNKIKVLKTKEDQLFLQKMLLTTIFFSIDLLTNILILVDVLTLDGIIYKILQYIFNIYVVFIIFYNLDLSLELYKTYNNPVHFFIRIFKQNKYNYLYEFFIIIIAIIVLIIDLIDPFDHLNDINYKDSDEDYDTFFTMNDKWKYGLIILITLISLIVCFIIKSKINKFAFRHQQKLISVINKKLLSNLIFFIYGIYYCLLFLLKQDKYNLLNNIGGCIFALITFIDIILHLSILSTSKFSEYKLKNSIVHFFSSCFKKDEKNEDNLIPLVNESITGDIGVSTSSFQINETSTSVLVSNSPLDKELISMYNNEIYIDDFWLSYFDQIMNIISSSLFQIYCSKFFSTKELTNQKLSNEIEISEDVSRIGNEERNPSTTILRGGSLDIGGENKIGDYTCNFDLCKTLVKDDYIKFKDILENGIKSELNINPVMTKVKSFFTPKCVFSISEQNLKSRQIAASLLSHMIFPNSKNKNNENPNATFWSLTASNGKEEYFNKLKSTCIKTFDKNFNLDIFDTNDDEISLDFPKKNNGIAQILDKYFSYIHGKGINGTFLPILVGVFKIKINNFKTLLIFITRNSLVENVPKNFFTYWQLIRFLNDGPKKIASSQFNNSTMVKDDPIFERMFQVESKKDNPDYNKITLKNYNDFQETISNDIKFLKNVDIRNFNLLLMYYEYENTQKHEKQGIIKIQKTENDKAEIIAESLPKDAIFEETMSGNIIKNEMFSPFTPGGGFFADDDFGALDKISGIGRNIGAVNLMDYSEKVNINAYDGLFDSFNCMCFFTFENIFDNRNNVQLTTNYYTSFQKKILGHFTEFKDKGK